MTTTPVRIGNPLEDTAVRAVGDGRFEGEIPDSWKIIFTNGGVAMMAALQATRQAVGDGKELSTASAVFTKALPIGPFSVDTEILRAGRSAAFVGADLNVGGGGDRALRLHAVYIAAGAGERPSIQRAFPEDVADVADCQGSPMPTSGPYGEIMAALPFTHQLERRLGLGTRPDSPDFVPGEARVGAWTRFRKTPRDSSGALDPLSYAILGDDNTAYLQHAGPDAIALVMITLQLDIHCFGATRSDWVLVNTHTRFADNRYIHSEVELWDPDRTLLAVVSQRAMLKTG